MGDEEKEQTIQEEDEHGNILIYPAWSKKNAPKDSQSKWEVPIYLLNIKILGKENDEQNCDN